MIKFLQYEEEFRINSRYGKLKDGKSFFIKQGTGNVLISAPHSVRHMREGTEKKPDMFTGALAKYVSEVTNCHLIAKIAFDDDDPNYSKNSPYKKALAKYVKEHNIEYVIDLHGASNSHPFNVDVGTDDDFNINFNNNIKRLILKSFKKERINKVKFNHTFKANTNQVSKYVNRQTGATAFQLEIASKYRKGDYYRNITAKALINLVYSLQNLNTLKPTMWLIHKEAEELPTWTQQEAWWSGFDVSVMHINNFSFNKTEVKYNNKTVVLPNLVLFKVYGFEFAKKLENVGARLFHSSTEMESSQNKFLTYTLLEQQHLPQPKTLQILKETNYDKIIKELGTPFVLKINKSSQGEGVFLIKNKTEYNKYLKQFNSEEFIAQKFIKNSAGTDIRLCVLNNKVIGAVRRINNNDFRSNYSLGGSFEVIKPNKKLKKLALKATKALNLKLSGVDVLIDNKNYLICEVNANPGYKMFWKAGINLPRLQMKYINKLLKQKTSN